MGELYLTSLVVLCRQTKSHVTPPVAVLVAGPSTVFSLRVGDTPGGVKWRLPAGRDLVDTSQGEAAVLFMQNLQNNQVVLYYQNSVLDGNHKCLSA